MNSGISENCRNFALENQRRAPQDATIPIFFVRGSTRKSEAGIAGCDNPYFLRARKHSKIRDGHCRIRQARMGSVT